MKPKKISPFARRIRRIISNYNPKKPLKLNPKTISMIRKKLSSKNSEERLAAIRTILFTKDKKSIPKLIEIAKTDNLRNRAKAIEIIGIVGTVEHLRFILSFGGSQSKRIRESTLEAVGNLAKKYPIESIKPLFLYGFNHKDPEFREALKRQVSYVRIKTSKK